jgi:predicted ArsR family transcriptional regulator
VKRTDRHTVQRDRARERRKRVLQCVTSRGPVATGDVTRELHLAPGGAIKDLQALEAAGLVEHAVAGAGGGGGYVWSRS